MQPTARTIPQILDRVAALRKDRAFLQALVLTSGRGASIVLAIISIRVFTGLIQPAEVGRYYLLLAAQTWASLLLLGPPSMYLWRNFVEWRSHDVHKKALGMFFAYAAAVGLVSLPIFAIAIVRGFVSASSPIATAVVLVVWLIALTATNTLSGVLNLMHRRGASVATSTGSAAVALIGSILAVMVFGHRSAEVWVAGAAAGHALTAIAAAIHVAQISSRSEPARGESGLESLRALARSVWHFSWPIAIITGLYWIQSQGYRRILIIPAGAAGLGQFAVAWSVGATIGIAVDTILQQWILPSFYHRVAGRNLEEIDATWQEYFAAVLRIIIPLGALMAAVSPFLLRLLAGPAFQQHPMLPVWAGVAEMFHIIGGLLYLGGIARRNTREMVLPNVPGAVWVLLTIYPATLYFGLHGAAAALMVSYVVLDTAMWLTVQRRIFAKVVARDLAFPAAIALAILLACAGAGLAGWRSSIVMATLTSIIAAMIFAAGALVALPRLLALAQPPDGDAAPAETSPLEDAPCL